MFTARKPSLWRRSYEISRDGLPIARWDPSWWRSGGRFELDGCQYEMHGNAIGSRFELIDPYGQSIASAQHVGRKRWTVQSGQRTYEFRRASLWRGDQVLLLGRAPAGFIRRASMWRGTAEADLPDMPQPVQVFVLCVVLAMWEAAAAAANASATRAAIPG